MMEGCSLPTKTDFICRRIFWPHFPLVIEPFGSIDGFRIQFDELLRIVRKIFQPLAIGKNAKDSAPGQLGLVLQIRQNIGQLNVAFLQHHGRGSRSFCGFNTHFADGHGRIVSASTHDETVDWLAQAPFVEGNDDAIRLIVPCFCSSQFQVGGRP